jgi:hypothetical protein
MSLDARTNAQLKDAGSDGSGEAMPVDFSGQDLGSSMGLDGTSEPDHIRALDKKRDASSMGSGHAIQRDLHDHALDQEGIPSGQCEQDQLALSPLPTTWPSDSVCADSEVPRPVKAARLSDRPSDEGSSAETLSSIGSIGGLVERPLELNWPTISTSSHTHPRATMSSSFSRSRTSTEESLGGVLLPSSLNGARPPSSLGASQRQASRVTFQPMLEGTPAISGAPAASIGGSRPTRT